MTKQKEALKLALELLAVGTFHSPELQARRTEVIERGLEALSSPNGEAQPEQEPVVVMELYTVGWDLVENIDIDWLESLPFGTKLYAHPHVQKLGMTEEKFKNDNTNSNY